MKTFLTLSIAGLINVLLAGLLTLHAPGGAGLESAQALPAQSPAPDPGLPVETPTPQPTTGPGEQETPGVVTQIFKVVFSSETLSEALAQVFGDAAGGEVQRMSKATDQLTGLFGELLQPPDKGYFTAIAASSLKTAAVIAPALFMVRLAMHHWQRLFSSDDSLLRVFGDWLAAGFLAAAAGPFLDLIVQAGWWMAGAAIGETIQLAQNFISVTMVSNVLSNLLNSGKTSMFAAIFALAGGLGGLLGVAGLAFAFAVSQAVLFVLGLLAPVVSVMAVVPQMRWLRALWFKAVAILALLPVVAGGIFKAGLTLAAFFGGTGLADMLIRLFWLWGVVGLIFSLAGILGKVTLSTAVESAGKLATGAGKIVSTARLAYGVGFSGGAPVGQTAAAGVESGSGPGSRSASGAGLPAPGQRMPFSYSLEQLQPSQVSPGSSSEYPLQPASPETTNEGGFAKMAPFFVKAGLDPAAVADRFPQEAAWMGAAYWRFQEQIETAPDPLMEAAQLGEAAGIIEMLQKPVDEQGDLG